MSDRFAIHQRHITELLKLDKDAFFETCLNVGFWMPKDDAERTTDFRHIASYCLIRRDGKFLTYLRDNSEKRLTDLWSIGVGGHMRRNDLENFHFSSTGEQCFVNNVLREIGEETGLEVGFSLSFSGAIAIDTSETERMHLGHVWVLDTDEDVNMVSECKDQVWLPLEELQRLKPLENWTRYLVEKMSE